MLPREIRKNELNDFVGLSAEGWGDWVHPYANMEWYEAGQPEPPLYGKGGPLLLECSDSYYVVCDANGVAVFIHTDDGNTRILEKEIAFETQESAMQFLNEWVVLSGDELCKNGFIEN